MANIDLGFFAKVYNETGTGVIQLGEKLGEVTFAKEGKYKWYNALFHKGRNEEANNKVRTELLKSLAVTLGVGTEGGKLTNEIVNQINRKLGGNLYQHSGDFTIDDKRGHVVSGRPLTERRLSQILCAAKKSCVESDKILDPENCSEEIADYGQGKITGIDSAIKNRNDVIEERAARVFDKLRDITYCMRPQTFLSVLLKAKNCDVKNVDDDEKRLLNKMERFFRSECNLWESRILEGSGDYNSKAKMNVIEKWCEKNATKPMTLASLEEAIEMAENDELPLCEDMD